jgi:enterochelin esterase-like enzyme
MAPDLTIKRIGLTLFLMTPAFMIAALLWFWSGSAVAPAPSTPDTADQAGTHQPEMVAPETLEQGFIIVVRDKADLASASDPIYLASNAVGWNAGDPKMVLTPRSDQRWQIVLDRPEGVGRLEFKFTRGSWEKCEVAADLSDLPNRTLDKVPASWVGRSDRPVIELEIEAWRDQRPDEPAARTADPYRKIEAVGTIRRLEVVGGGGPAATRTRDLIVWLPPGYDDPANATRRYPTLYLLDGQNVFEQQPGVPGEWRADETATRLIEEGMIEPLIIVGIPHAGKDRAAEYLPIPFQEGWAADADGFMEFVVGEVVPRVERAFRVRTDADSCGIGGSSFGAVASLYIATRRPDVFGIVLAESPSMLVDREDFWAVLEAVERWPDQVWIGMGDHEAGFGDEQAELNEKYVQAARRLYELAKNRTYGIGSTGTHVDIGRNQTHNEEAWADRLETALTTLYRPR